MPHSTDAHMSHPTLTKVGNSMAVLLPKTLRQEACIDEGLPLTLSSPRKGVIVITSAIDDSVDRLRRLEDAEARIQSRQCEPWPADMTADDMLKTARKDRAYDIPSV